MPSPSATRAWSGRDEEKGLAHDCCPGPPSGPCLAGRRARLSQLRRSLSTRRPARLLRMLRSAGDRLRPGGARSSHSRGYRRRPALDLALRGPAAGRSGSADPGRLGHRHDSADPRRPARRRARFHRPSVDQGRLGQSDALVQGPGGQRRHDGGAGTRLRPHRLRLDRQSRELGRGARGPHRNALDRLHPVRPGAGEDRPERHLRRHVGRYRRFLRRRQSAVQRALGARRVRVDRRSSMSTFGRTTPKGPRRSASRWPSSWAGGSRRRSSPDGLGLAADQGEQGVPRAGVGRPRAPVVVAGLSAPSRPAARRSRPRSRTAGTSCSR